MIKVGFQGQTICSDLVIPGQSYSQVQYMIKLECHSPKLLAFESVFAVHYYSHVECRGTQGQKLSASR